jgi:hypothetical protein
MLDNFQNAYIVGNLIVGLPIWTIFFLRRKDLRKEMLLSSILIGILAPLWSPWFIADYWHPESLNFLRVASGDFMYGFFFGGIANVIYEQIFAKRYAKQKTKIYWAWFVSLFALGLLVFNISILLGINSIYAAITAFLVWSIITIYFRRDLLFDSLISGALFLFITLITYAFLLALYPGITHAWWKLQNLSGILIMSIPLEELLWAFSFGMIAGPFYEFFMGLKFKKP